MKPWLTLLARSLAFSTHSFFTFLSTCTHLRILKLSRITFSSAPLDHTPDLSSIPTLEYVFLGELPLDYVHCIVSRLARSRRLSLHIRIGTAADALDALVEHAGVFQLLSPSFTLIALIDSGIEFWDKGGDDRCSLYLVTRIYHYRTDELPIDVSEVHTLGFRFATPEPQDDLLLRIYNRISFLKTVVIWVDSSDYVVPHLLWLSQTHHQMMSTLENLQLVHFDFRHSSSCHVIQDILRIYQQCTGRLPRLYLEGCTGWKIVKDQFSALLGEVIEVNGNLTR